MRIKRKELIISGSGESSVESSDGVTLRDFVGKKIGAAGFSTAMTTYDAGASTALHVHDCSEAMTVLEGVASVSVEGRTYTLSAYDCLHVPSGFGHSVNNVEKGSQLRIHSAYGSAQPTSESVRGRDAARGGDDARVETILRFAECPVYEPSPGAFFRDLFARRLGSIGICGGYGVFNPGSSLPCHTHNYDESITIVSGAASCFVRGSRYGLSGYDTAFVPEGQPHRFINESDAPMAMIWVYAGDEPDRLLVDNGYCSGTLTWPEELAN